VQLFDGSEILDERILGHKPGIPWLVSTIVRTDAGSNIPGDMVLIPGAEIIMGPNNPDQFIPYPEYDQVPVTVLPFLMDIYPVTNKQFNDFIEDSGYKPPDTTNFLKHWKGGSYKPGEADLPVVYVDLEDAKAYARWAGKRLPAEAEWQLAARGTDDRLWPWGNQLKKERYNHLGRLTPVTAFPAGSSPYGVRDLVGNVWQLTGDVYENGSYTFVMIRGGSYFNPSSSIWYVRGGPQPLDCTQMLLMMSPGFNRCATVGFRCVRDIRQQ
jgi:formylglycine-generating enzyme required for sulfatase activity